MRPESERSLVPTLHMIGNAHLDPVWLWRWREGFQEAKATFRSALQRMREDAAFLFTSSSAALYEWIEGNDPQMFEEIKARVAEGRWEIVGGWWIQPDCNIPSGESFVRQGLYGQRYFAGKLGVTATVGYNPDSFGHAGSLPQILLKSGLAHYVFMRPQPHEMTLPARLFHWESADGSRVLTFQIPYEYCTWGGSLEQHVRRCAAELREDTTELMCFYGVGNHGGGPTRENLKSIREMSVELEDLRLQFSTPGRYFNTMGTRNLELPVVRDELQHHASGCYSAHSGIKRWNRTAENALATAETFSALAGRVTGVPYPSDFDRAWKGVLFNQFHDILAGTSIEPAYEDARNVFGEAMTIADRNLNGAIQSLSWNIGIEEEEGMRPIVVFNPHSWPIQAVVELEFGPISGGSVLLDSEGGTIPWQRGRSLATVGSGSRNRLSFMAHLPACGYEVYRLVPRAEESEAAGSPEPRTVLETERFRLEIDPLSGNLTSLYGKHEGFEWLRAEARALVLDDPSDTWSHGVLRYDRVVGQFAPTSIRMLESGPVKSVLRVESGYGRSRLTQDFVAYPRADHIDVHVTVDWRERFKMLKLNFPLNLDFTTSTYETPYGHIRRPANGEEEPGGRWVDITGVGRNKGELVGLSVLNDGKHSFSISGREFNLTVLRSPIFAHHVPHVPAKDSDYTFLDQGIQRFTYTLLPHVGSWEDAGTVQRAAVLNRPPVALMESCHPGPLPLRDSYVAAEPSSILVSAVKKAEDGDDLVLRCFESSGRTTDARICLSVPPRSFDVRFGPGEIKTFRVPPDGAAPIVETNLLEWTDDELKAAHEGRLESGRR